MSKPSARKPTVIASGYETSIARTAIAALLVVLGIAWIAVYTNVAQDAANCRARRARSRTTRCPWMADLEKWNYLIGFGLIFVGLAVSAHKSTPLGRGRGVVVGMLGCFLIGLVWIVTFYFVGAATLGAGDERPRAVQPAGRHRLHGRRASPSPPSGSSVPLVTRGVVLHRVIPSCGQLPCSGQRRSAARRAGHAGGDQRQRDRPAPAPVALHCTSERCCARGVDHRGAESAPPTRPPMWPCQEMPLTVKVKTRLGRSRSAPSAPARRTFSATTARAPISPKIAPEAPRVWMCGSDEQHHGGRAGQAGDQVERRGTAPGPGRSRASGRGSTAPAC